MRAFTVSNVHFTAKADEELHAQLIGAAYRAGVPWHEAVMVIDAELAHACRMAAHAKLVEMAGWPPVDWFAARQRTDAAK